MKIIISTRLFIFLVFILWSLTLDAQLSKPVFKRYTVDDGLESNGTESIVQDRNGFIWFNNFGLIILFRWHGLMVMSLKSTVTSITTHYYNLVLV